MSFKRIEITPVNGVGVAFALLLLHENKQFNADTVPVHVGKYMLQHVKSQAMFHDSTTDQQAVWNFYRNVDPLAAEVPLVSLSCVDGQWKLVSCDKSIPQ